MKEFWDTRYREEDYAYGEVPNAFFKNTLPSFTPGKILLPAEGEGRNAVFAASLGWEVFACDLSDSGREKALKLAAKQGVSIQYEVGDLEEIALEEAQFDAVGLIYAHFPPAKKTSFHQKIYRALKPGGVLMLEGFSKSHLAYHQRDERVGGPNDLGRLFSVEELLQDFEGIEIRELYEQELYLEEIGYHHY
jgi:SAM-dependent methyltransferase